MSKKILVCGGSGFIGHHLANRLTAQGHEVYVVDIKKCEYNLDVKDFWEEDLSYEDFWFHSGIDLIGLDEVYQLAADMGGAGYIFSGDNDANVMNTSALINLHCAKWASQCQKKPKIFYSSSACIYPKYNQEDPNNPKCSEGSAYPAYPDSEYGWEKLFSERLYGSFKRNYGIDIRIARFHNIFGPEGTWFGGKEKAPAALCRKVIEAEDNGTIEIWGPGTQTRSFLIIDECLDGIQRLMNSDYSDPINIGSAEMISINGLAKMIIGFSRKNLTIKNIPGPVGVAGRTSDNKLCAEKLNWAPSKPLVDGMKQTYDWIKTQV